MRHIALGVMILVAFFVPALLAAAQAIYRAGQQKAEEEQKHHGYYEAHPYIRAQKQALSYAAERLRYWLFVRDNKSCHACCLRCKWYYECLKDEMARKERKRRK